MYRKEFALAYAALAIVAAGAVAALLVYALGGSNTITRTVRVPEAPLTQSSSSGDVKARFDGPPAQSIPGTDIGLNGGTCDVYQLSDGGVLVCHP